jgi:hypothetical protein
VLDAYGGLFVQSGFGAPEAFSANLPLPVYPNAAPASDCASSPSRASPFKRPRLRWKRRTGLDADPSPNAAVSTEFNRHGTHWALRPDEGALLVGEISYRFNQPPEGGTLRDAHDCRRTARSAHQPHRSRPARGLAGSYEAGFLYHTDDFADIYDVTLADLGSSSRQLPRGIAERTTRST